jgi:hypothetical protein
VWLQVNKEPCSVSRRTVQRRRRRAVTAQQDVGWIYCSKVEAIKQT